MKNTNSFFIRCAGVLSASLLIAGGTAVRAADKAQGDAFPNLESYIKITGQAASISGDEAAFKSRVKEPNQGGGGIEDLHLSKDVSKTTTVVLDGHALAGSEDYLGQVKVTKNEVGSVDMGYSRFRTFYDGVGAFFPLSQQWMTLKEQDLHVDRSKFWIEGKLELPKMPVVTLRYVNEQRTGQKDSTIWGSSANTGLPFNLAPISVNYARKGTASYIDLNEKFQELELSVKHKINNTTVLLRLFGEETDNYDTRHFVNFPGDVVPWSIASLSTTTTAPALASPQNIAKAAAPYSSWNSQVLTDQSDGIKTKVTGVTYDSDTVVSDKLTVKVGANYELVHADYSGKRPVITTTPTATGAVPITTATFTDMSGGNREKVYTGNISVNWRPEKGWFVKLGYRAQAQFIRGVSLYNVVASSGTAPAVTYTTTPRRGWAKLHQNARTPVLEVRYTGIKDLALYATASRRSLNGDERNTSHYNYLTAANGTNALNNVSEKHGDYTVGASWKQSQMLTLRGEFFQKGHKDNSVGYGTGSILGDNYLLDLKTEGTKLTAIAKPNEVVAFTTRYVNQRSKGEVTGYLPTFPAFDSLNGKSHIISESIDWTPSKTFYVQANANLVFNVISTIYPRAGVTAAVVNTSGVVTARAYDTNRILQNSDNNYITWGLLTGFAFDKDTDMQIQANVYRAKNDNSALAALTLPYGVAVEDQSVTLGVKHKFSDKWVGHAKLGYFDSKNATTGGRANYHGPMAYLSFDYGL